MARFARVTDHRRQQSSPLCSSPQCLFILIPTFIFLSFCLNRTGKTYSYVFSEPNRMGGIAKPYPSWMGADHADDLQYVFGKPFTTPLGYWPRHRDLSGYMIAYWTNFAKTG